MPFPTAVVGSDLTTTSAPCYIGSVFVLSILTSAIVVVIDRAVDPTPRSRWTWLTTAVFGCAPWSASSTPTPGCSRCCCSWSSGHRGPIPPPKRLSPHGLSRHGVESHGVESPLPRITARRPARPASVAGRPSSGGGARSHRRRRSWPREPRSAGSGVYSAGGTGRGRRGSRSSGQIVLVRSRMAAKAMPWTAAPNACAAVSTDTAQGRVGQMGEPEQQRGDQHAPPHAGRPQQTHHRPPPLALLEDRRGQVHEHEQPEGRRRNGAGSQPRTARAAAGPAVSTATAGATKDGRVNPAGDHQRVAAITARSTATQTSTKIRLWLGPRTL